MRKTLTQRSDFLELAASDISYITPFFVAKARKTKTPNDPKYGLVATLKTFKTAVARNRAKRLLREWIRITEKEMNPNFDYTFVARHAILHATRDNGLKQMTTTLKNIK